MEMCNWNVVFLTINYNSHKAKRIKIKLLLPITDKAVLPKTIIDR